jgi:glucose/mannose-6-phosphate isomerase
MTNSIEKIILDFPEQIKNGFNQKPMNFSFKQNFNSVLICGMGGSALAGEFLKKFYPIRIHRNYKLPQDATINRKKTLIVVISYSGNTEETISAYNSARKRKLPLVVISNNGLLEKKARKDAIPFLSVKTKNIEPRMVVLEQISILIYLLKKLAISPLQGTQLKCPQINPVIFKEEAKKIAENLINKVPLIYTSSANKAIAYYWKALFNESAKIPAFWNVFPEINHNELMQGKGLSWIDKFCILNVIDSDDYLKIQKRMRLTASIFNKKGIAVNTIKMRGKTPLQKMFNAIILGNWVVLYLAQKLSIDPIDPDVREEFKEMMK